MEGGIWSRSEPNVNDCGSRGIQGGSCSAGIDGVGGSITLIVHVGLAVTMSIERVDELLLDMCVSASW